MLKKLGLATFASLFVLAPFVKASNAEKDGRPTYFNNSNLITNNLDKLDNYLIDSTSKSQNPSWLVPWNPATSKHKDLFPGIETANIKPWYWQATAGADASKIVNPALNWGNNYHFFDQTNNYGTVLGGEQLSKDAQQKLQYAYFSQYSGYYFGVFNSTNFDYWSRNMSTPTTTKTNSALLPDGTLGPDRATSGTSEAPDFFANMNFPLYHMFASSTNDDDNIWINLHSLMQQTSVEAKNDSALIYDKVSKYSRGIRGVYQSLQPDKNQDPYDPDGTTISQGLKNDPALAWLDGIRPEYQSILPDYGPTPVGDMGPKYTMYSSPAVAAQSGPNNWNLSVAMPNMAYYSWDADGIGNNIPLSFWYINYSIDQDQKLHIASKMHAEITITAKPEIHSLFTNETDPTKESFWADTSSGMSGFDTVSNIEVKLFDDIKGPRAEMKSDKKYEIDHRFTLSNDNSNYIYDYAIHQTNGDEKYMGIGMPQDSSFTQFQSWTGDNFNTKGPEPRLDAALESLLEVTGIIQYPNPIVVNPINWWLVVAGTLGGLVAVSTVLGIIYLYTKERSRKN